MCHLFLKSLEEQVLAQLSATLNCIQLIWWCPERLRLAQLRAVTVVVRAIAQQCNMAFQCMSIMCVHVAPLKMIEEERKRRVDLLLQSCLPRDHRRFRLKLFEEAEKAEDYRRRAASEEDHRRRAMRSRSLATDIPESRKIRNSKRWRRMNSHDVIQLQRSYLCLAFAFFLFLVRSELDHFNLLVGLT